MAYIHSEVRSGQFDPSSWVAGQLNGGHVCAALGQGIGLPLCFKRTISPFACALCNFQ